MNPDNRTDLLELIADLRQRYPNWRFGQHVANVADWAEQGVWHVEDDQLLAAAQAHLRQANASHAPSG